MRLLARKIGDASIRESRHKAEIIIKDATLKAERIVSGANQEILNQKKELARLQQTVSDFRSKLLNIYKEHLTLIDALPARKPESQAEAEEPTQEEQQESLPSNKPVEEKRPYRNLRVLMRLLMRKQPARCFARKFLTLTICRPLKQCRGIILQFNLVMNQISPMEIILRTVSKTLWNQSSHKICQHDFSFFRCFPCQKKIGLAICAVNWDSDFHIKTYH